MAIQLVLFKSPMVGCYISCLQSYCRAQGPSVPNRFHQGSQLLHQPTGIIHLQNVSSTHSVLSPKSGYFAYNSVKYVQPGNQQAFVWPLVILGGKQHSDKVSVEKVKIKKKLWWWSCPRWIMQDLKPCKQPNSASLSCACKAELQGPWWHIMWSHLFALTLLHWC